MGFRVWVPLGLWFHGWKVIHVDLCSQICILPKACLHAEFNCGVRIHVVLYCSPLALSFLIPVHVMYMRITVYHLKRSGLGYVGWTFKAWCLSVGLGGPGAWTYMRMSSHGLHTIFVMICMLSCLLTYATQRYMDLLKQTHLASKTR